MKLCMDRSLNQTKAECPRSGWDWTHDLKRKEIADMLWNAAVMRHHLRLSILGVKIDLQKAVEAHGSVPKDVAEAICAKIERAWNETK